MQKKQSELENKDKNIIPSSTKKTMEVIIPKGKNLRLKLLSFVSIDKKVNRKMIIVNPVYEISVAIAKNSALDNINSAETQKTEHKKAIEASRVSFLKTEIIANKIRKKENRKKITIFLSLHNKKS